MHLSCAPTRRKPLRSPVLAAAKARPPGGASFISLTRKPRIRKGAYDPIKYVFPKIRGANVTTSRVLGKRYFLNSLIDFLPTRLTSHSDHNTALKHFLKQCEGIFL